MVKTCDRCKKEAYYQEQCNSCSRYVCRSCQKASKSASKTERLVICKDCWGNLRRRKTFESA